MFADAGRTLKALVKPGLHILLLDNWLDAITGQFASKG